MARVETGPIEGIRVVDFSTVVSGPVATQALGDLGADVIKVEPPIGDFSRLAGGEPHAGLNGFFVANNRNKRSIVLDLRQPAAVEVARDLATSADVVLENFRPGVADRIGIGYEALRPRNPRLVYVAISGFGPDGPYASLPAYDHIIQALTGFMYTQGSADAPRMIQCVAADKFAGVQAANAVLAALLAREKSGEGQRVDVPMLDVYAAYILPEALGPRAFVDAPRPEIGTPLFRTADGFVVGVVTQDDQLHALCRALGRPDIAEDQRFSTIAERFRHLEAFYALLAEELSKHPTQGFVARAREEGAPFAPVLDVEASLRDPQFVHNGTVEIREVEGAGPVRFLRPPLRFEKTPARIHRPPPRLAGAHGRDRGGDRLRPAAHRGAASGRGAALTLLARIGLASVLAIALAGCFGPKDRRPGMRLPGEVAPTPADWSFTEEHALIAIEVRTPYFLPHSVTIVCGTLDGKLYVGARDPETKRWPGWVDDDPEVRLGIGERVYEAKLDPITNEALVARVRQAMATKYGRPPRSDDVPIRYWQVVPR